MTMEWKVSFTFANTLYHSEHEVKQAIEEAIKADELSDIDDLKVELI